jgi:hypothetical protein
MNAKLITIQGLTLLAGMQVAFADQPVIESFNPNTGLVWTNPIHGNVSVIERSTNGVTGPWVPFFYDRGTHGVITTPIPPSSSGQMFYRIGVWTNIPDPFLIMDLSFDNAFSNGAVLDISGHGNNGLRYGIPGNQTNWPTLTVGPDGSRAAEFHWYIDGYGKYGKSGDYIGIPYSPSFLNLTQATITAWVHYYASANNIIENDWNSTIFNAGQDDPGTWDLGRIYSSFDNTKFSVYTGPGNEVEVLYFPDASTNGDSGGWHHYSVTFSNGVVKGYFDGSLFETSSVPVAALTMGGQYMGIACWTFNADPWMDLSVDEDPNNAWLNGAVDDLRIYNRTLSDTEIAALYLSFDKLPPSTPSNLVSTVISSSEVALHWSQASDIFGIAGYVLRRNGSIVATTTNTAFFDGGLPPQSTNSYTVQAFDPGSNYSAESAAAVAVTLPSGSGVDLILDDADGLPWITQLGTWFSGSGATLPGYYGSGFLSEENITVGESLTFRPPLPEPGSYTVYIRYPGRPDINWLFASNVPVDIVHNGVTNTVIVDEQDNFGTWNLLGQFSFSAGTNDFVRLRTDGTSGYVFGDAFRFVK